MSKLIYRAGGYSRLDFKTYDEVLPSVLTVEDVLDEKTRLRDVGEFPYQEKKEDTATVPENADTTIDGERTDKGDKEDDFVGDYSVKDDDKAFLKNATREEFISRFKDDVAEIVKGTGIFPETVMAQLIQEQGIFRDGSQVRAGAGGRKGYNLGNIKQWWGSNSDLVYGHKDDDRGADGKLVESNFLQYKSFKDGIQGYVDFIVKNKRYRPALSATSPEEQLALIAYGGYAGGYKGSNNAKNIRYRDSLQNILRRDVAPLFRRGGILIYKR